MRVVAVEELAKSATTLTLPSKMLPMLLLLMTRSAGCCCRGACKDRCCRSDVLPMLFLNDDKDAADTAEWDCCSVCSRKQTNKGRAAEELAKTADAAVQRLAANAAFEDYNGAAVFANRRGD